MAYNLVRAIMFQSAQRARIDPRQLSFTYACNIVLDGYPKVLAARTTEQQQQELGRIIDLVADADFPQRTNAARIHERCGVVATVFLSGKGRKTK